MIPFWVKALALGLFLAAMVAACHHRDTGLVEQGRAEQRATDQLVADALKKDAAQKLDTALHAKVEAERALRDAKDKQEVSDAKNVRSVADLAGRVAALTRDNFGRLRDPFAKASGCGPSSSGPATATATAPSAGASDAAAPAGLLSVELTSFLRDQAALADSINLAYISCRSALLQ